MQNICFPNNNFLFKIFFSNYEHVQLNRMERLSSDLSHFCDSEYVFYCLIFYPEVKFCTKGQNVFPCAKIGKKCRLVPAVCFVEKVASEFPRMVIFCTRGHIGMFCANYLLESFLHKGTTCSYTLMKIYLMLKIYPGCVVPSLQVLNYLSLILFLT